jgi:eukaryotic-like serine/threonine-protein kinase
VIDEQWPRIKALFEAAAERPVDERDAFLAAETGDDNRLRRDVESLLASDALDGSFLDHLPAAPAPVLAELLADRWIAPEHTPPLMSGFRIGPYDIVALLGAGAMGEVYRARDTKLNRDVALKVLPERLALDPDCLARFKREAQLLATLTHPNIAAIHGLEESTRIHALVLELVDGPTLAEHIARGGPGGAAGLPLDEALAIARQVAEALEAAHEKGIIHRDVKPANIKIARDGVVKVLDFGLARVWDGAPHADLSSSPSLTAGGIGERTILGTPAYMSPEQARGQSLDRRTDVWSFGCVLYEMLTGGAPFAADTISDSLAATLEHEPDYTRLPADTPGSIRRLLRRCLEKDRKRRLDSAAGARLEIDDAIAPAEAEAAGRRTTPSRLTPVGMVALAGCTASAALVTWALMRPVPSTPVLPSRFSIVAPPGKPLNVSGSARDIALSPDGRYLVYRFGGTNSAGSPLMVRAIDQLDGQPLAGVTYAYAPFFSPDSQWIGFFENAQLKKVSVSGGPAVTLGAVIGGALGASWGDDNSIVYATDDPNTGLWRVSADGGEPTLLTTPDAARHETEHAFPSVLPGGRGVLFTIVPTGAAETSQVAFVDVTTGRRKTLVSGSQAEYIDVSRAGKAEGYLTYATAGTVRAVPFDPVRLETLGTPVPVVERVPMKPSGAANYAVSRAGPLLYMIGAVDQTTPRSLVWVDRKGHEEPIRVPLRPYGTPRLSPDGTRVAVEVYDQNTDIWIWDLARETLRRLTFDPAGEGMSVWTPDGRGIIYESGHPGVPNLYRQAADGTGAVERLVTSATPQWPTSITPDGAYLTGFDLSGVIFVPLARSTILPQHGPARGISREPLGTLVDMRFQGNFADFSPNGRYIAYQSRESGRDEIYVRPFPRVDSGRWQVSTAGGTRPVWARSGRELFYLDASNALTSVQVSASGPTFSAGKPVTVFETKYVESNPSRHYDVSADGQRFLMIKDGPANPNAMPASLVVVEHWFEELTQLTSSRTPPNPAPR